MKTEEKPYKPCVNDGPKDKRVIQREPLFDDYEDTKSCYCDGKHVCRRCLQRENEFYEED